MITRILRRFAASVILLFLVSIISFYLIILAPGDVSQSVELNPRMSPETIAAIRQRSDVDAPPSERYLAWFSGLFSGNAGYSYLYDSPAMSLVLPRLGNTLLLSASAYLLAWLVGLPLGIAAAVTPRKWLSGAIYALASTAISMPRIFVALLAILFVARTGWLPLGGRVALNHDQLNLMGRFGDTLAHLVLPAIVLSLYPMALYVMQSRAALSEALTGDYVRTARAKGIPESLVVYRHALRNAVNPLITLLGFSIGDLLGGAVLVETIMAWPGLGKLTVEAVLARDAYVVLTSVLFSSVMLIGGNFVAEILLNRLDPRVRRPT